ncbi:MAG: phosphopantetheine adenylyltransferase [Methanothrix sp.]|jgi:pantetheine-phosphate adenylyltransferase|nr:phosphopantetheine adenylyltransferase [Methanothrix sp.]
MARVAVGGTFDPIHDGHICLLKRAYELGMDGEVVIGLTSNDMARESRTRPVRDFSIREKNLRAVILRCFGIDDAKITKLDDQCGSSIYEDFDYIVVSPETLPMAERINRLRDKKNLKPLKISVIEYQLAQDNVRISSTRISQGKIDRHGRLLSGL